MSTQAEQSLRREAVSLDAAEQLSKAPRRSAERRAFQQSQEPTHELAALAVLPAELPAQPEVAWAVPPEVRSQVGPQQQAAPQVVPQAAQPLPSAA